MSLFEPVHGSAPDIAGQGIANPLAAILSAGMLVDHLGHPELDHTIREAVKACLHDRQVTRELGGDLTTAAVTDAVLSRLS